MKAHLCSNGKKIRKYASIFCSMCMMRGAVELDMSEERIDEYNACLVDRSHEKYLRAIRIWET